MTRYRNDLFPIVSQGPLLNIGAYAPPLVPCTHLCVCVWQGSGLAGEIYMCFNWIIRWEVIGTTHQRLWWQALWFYSDRWLVFLSISMVYVSKQSSQQLTWFVFWLTNWAVRQSAHHVMIHWNCHSISQWRCRSRLHPLQCPISLEWRQYQLALLQKALMIYTCLSVRKRPWVRGA